MYLKKNTRWLGTTPLTENSRPLPAMIYIAGVNTSIFHVIDDTGTVYKSHNIPKFYFLSLLIDELGYLLIAVEVHGS